MASKVIGMSLALVLVAVLCGGATAQSGCTSALMGLSSCLNYVTGNSSSPSSSCCSGLSSVVQSQPRCLCSLLNGGGSTLGITINQTLALQLPGACNVQTPPSSQCNAANGPTTSVATPASSPVGSPADSSDDTPETEVPSTPSQTNLPSGGAGSKTVPSTDGSTSNGSITKGSSQLVLLVLFIASFASVATVRF
ncbi:hypothetical protein LguiB_000266 [Lonicera macranthoides]